MNPVKLRICDRPNPSFFSWQTHNFNFNFNLERVGIRRQRDVHLGRCAPRNKETGKDQTNLGSVENRCATSGRQWVVCQSLQNFAAVMHEWNMTSFDAGRHLQSFWSGCHQEHDWMISWRRHCLSLSGPEIVWLEVLRILLWHLEKMDPALKNT